MDDELRRPPDNVIRVGYGLAIREATFLENPTTGRILDVRPAFYVVDPYAIFTFKRKTGPEFR
jgi:hypothetical protein